MCEIVLYNVDYATGYSLPDFLFRLCGLCIDRSEERLGKKQNKTHQYLKLVLGMLFHKTEITQSEFFY